MRLVVDAVGVRPGSAAIVIGHVLAGWRQVAPEDDVLVLVDGRPRFEVPDGAQVVSLVDDASNPLRRLVAQSWGVRRAARRFAADALLSAVCASSFLGATVPSGTVVYDLRHELRPEQFSRRRRVARRLTYGWTFRRADALFCISERTRGDLVRSRPRLERKALATLLGADHAATWATATGAAALHRPYVLAFGHFANKNVDAVLHAWALTESRHPELELRICGLNREARDRVEHRIEELRLMDRVALLPWLDDAEFRTTFAGASAVVFPSDFEGFGLPALEALLLEIPVVISDDAALLEVTAGHAVVARRDGGAVELAEALDAALAKTEDERSAGAAHARTFTWARTAAQMRSALVRAN
jgi:glycosyltransferase involved in cell wall biosynthesis